MLTIELGDPKPSQRCPDCGAEVEMVFGFVYSDGVPHAVYHASYSSAHRDEGASLRIVVGDWSDNAPPASRTSFGLEVRASGREYEFMLVGPSRSAWRATAFAAPMLSREDALAHPYKQEVFHIAEHIIHEDARLFEFLQSGHQAA
jgi:hypothetical protein